jgi:hypothetical protein
MRENKKLHSVAQSYSQGTTMWLYKSKKLQKGSMCNFNLSAMLHQLMRHRVTLCEHCGTLCNSFSLKSKFINVYV